MSAGVKRLNIGSRQLRHMFDGPFNEIAILDDDLAQGQ